MFCRGCGDWADTFGWLLQHVLALLRLANHDSDVFYKFKQVLIDKIVFPYATELIQMDVRSDIEKVCTTLPVTGGVSVLMTVFVAHCRCLLAIIPCKKVRTSALRLAAC
jgi:hypothetical protein